MKVVVLLAGRGSRLSELTRDRHKALIEVSGKPILGHILERLVWCGVRDVHLVLGYRSQSILDYARDRFKDAGISATYNPVYATTNNLYSLYCAKDVLQDDEFVVCNGDLLLNREIIRGLVQRIGVSAVAVDDSPRDSPIDSPGIVARAGRILDLGRHVPFEQSAGYAIGLYRFSRELGTAFFPAAEELLNRNPNAGFHDPLRPLFASHRVDLQSTAGMSWTDVDTATDLPLAEKILRTLEIEER